MRDKLNHYLSYLWDIQVDYRKSEINDDLIVFLSKGRYQLCSANAIYSYEDKYANFSNVFRDHLDLHRWQGKDVLILGLGLGSIPITLDQMYPGRWSFTAVEIDDVVCELASIYGYPKINSPINTIVGDAVGYMATQQEKFDMICIDLFIDDIMPEASMTIDFLNNIKDALSSEGVVIANTLAFSEEQQEKSQKFYDDLFIQSFPKGRIIKTHVNYMLVNDSDLFLFDPTNALAQT